MGRTLNQIIADLPLDRQAEIDTLYREMKSEVESLRQLREAAEKTQAQIAAALHIRQPSVSKIEKQTDMYLSTLRDYVGAVGGTLELVVNFPNGSALRLAHLSDVFVASELKGTGRAPRRTR
jgi:DNA-binding XRE family transcriptional regulator